jgi:hypothetical protein
MYTTVGGIRKESNITFFVLLYISSKGSVKIICARPPYSDIQRQYKLAGASRHSKQTVTSRALLRVDWLAYTQLGYDWRRILNMLRTANWRQLTVRDGRR